MLFTALVLASLASAAGPVRPLVLAPAARSVPRLPLVLPPAALFDWDDTLADEGAVWQAVVEATSEKLGLPSPSRDLAERAWILDRPNFYGRLYPGKEPAEVDRTFVELMELARAGEEVGGRRFDGIPLLDHATESLDALKERGVPLGLVSNKGQADLDADLDKAGVRGYFSLVQGVRPGIEKKPSPQPISAALDAMGLSGDRGRVWYVGNQPSDVEASLASGTRPVLMDLRWRQSLARRYREARADGKVVYVNGNGGLLRLIRRLQPRP